MAKPFHELRERLLRAGVAPRHVRRYLTELADHLADLSAEEERAGRSRGDAESAALIRLGGMDELAKAMIEQRQFQSWCVRAPWATFGLAPLVVLVSSWFIALLILWFGWQTFLPGADTPFAAVRGAGPHRIFELANVYFQLDRLLYFAAPILVGWGIGLIAVRQRFRAGWPIVGFLLIALMGGTARVHAGLTAVPADSDTSAWTSPLGLPCRLFPTPYFMPWGFSRSRCFRISFGDCKRRTLFQPSSLSRTGAWTPTQTHLANNGI